MIALSLADIAAAVSGTLDLGDSGDTAQTLVSGLTQTDSRDVSEGMVFVARRGEETDGHLFVSQAIDQGAALIIGERITDTRRPTIIVDDATEALRLLAREVVRRVLALERLRIVAITGSNGKTTTKNLVNAMLTRVGSTVASEKSFNNEVGGPLTVLRADETTEFLVAEMGASAVGEIARLVDMAPPHIGVVLSVGMAHAGEFGGIEHTFEAKSEMVRALPRSAVAVLNREDPRVAKMAELTEARTVWFGLTDTSDVWASDIEVSTTGTAFTLHTGNESRKVQFGVLGEHHVMNALAAAAVALECGLSLDEIIEVLEATTRPAKWRMEVSRHPRNITLINDAYNASPDSMRAALKTLALVGHPEGRTVAVLGAMSELGEFSGEEHDRIGILAVRLRLSQLIIVGPEARRVHISAINEGAWSDESLFFETQDEALEFLTTYLQPNDTVIVKSSNSAGLRFLGDRLGELLA